MADELLIFAGLNFRTLTVAISVDKNTLFREIVSPSIAWAVVGSGSCF